MEDLSPKAQCVPCSWAGVLELEGFPSLQSKCFLLKMGQSTRQAKHLFAKSQTLGIILLPTSCCNPILVSLGARKAQNAPLCEIPEGGQYAPGLAPCCEFDSKALPSLASLPPYLDLSLPMPPYLLASLPPSPPFHLPPPHPPCYNFPIVFTTMGRTAAVKA